MAELYFDIDLKPFEGNEKRLHSQDESVFSMLQNYAEKWEFYFFIVFVLSCSWSSDEFFHDRKKDDWRNDRW